MPIFVNMPNAKILQPSSLKYAKFVFSGRKKANLATLLLDRMGHPPPSPKTTLTGRHCGFGARYPILPDTECANVPLMSRSSLHKHERGKFSCVGSTCVAHLLSNQLGQWCGKPKSCSRLPITLLLIDLTARLLCPMMRFWILSSNVCHIRAYKVHSQINCR